MRRRLLAGGAAVATAVTLFAVPVLGASASAPHLRLGVPTVVDPIRGGAEPYIAIARHDQPFVSAPGGTSVQTSWFWTSRDHGLTYGTLGPSEGHWVCNNTGGGDSSLVYDRKTDLMYLMDQQALVSVASGRFAVGAHRLQSSKCFSTPAMTADRPFQAVLHPGVGQHPPQVKQDGGKPMIYLSWQCNGCLGGNPASSGGGLAFAWSTDGVNWHAADPGVPADTLATNQFFESPSIASYGWHGTMVADKASGYVYTAIACSTSSCPNGKSRNEVGIAIGKPGSPSARADASNVGQFVSMTYQTAAHTYRTGKPLAKTGSLFPVIAADSAGTLYEAWIEGDGVNDDPNSTPNPQEWHLYYTYSKDRPAYRHWAPTRRVDLPSMSKTNAFGWMTAGAPGRLGFIWLGTNVREQPSKQNPHKKWYAYMSVATHGDTSHPTFSESRVGRSPMHIGDICLQGTICAATTPPGNRNMADFISLDYDSKGALTATYSADANRIAPLPTDLVPGVPVTFTVHQTGGPGLLGGTVSDPHFSTAPTVRSPLDPRGDGHYPSLYGRNRPGLDLRRISVTHNTKGVDVTIRVADLSKTTSPSSAKNNVWYLVTWIDPDGRLWFARAESDSGGSLTFHAGEPGAYDRPGIAYYTVPTLVDYRGGTAITGKRVGNRITMHVPASLVGHPKSSDIFESVTGWTVLDNGRPPFDTATNRLGNVPLVVDATAAFDAGSSGGETGPSTGACADCSTGGTAGPGGGLATTGGPLAGYGLAALVALVTAGLLVRRRRSA